MPESNNPKAVRWRVELFHCPEVDPILIHPGEPNEYLEPPDEAEEAACIGCPIPTSIEDLIRRDIRECPATWLVVPDA